MYESATFLGVILCRVYT